MEEIRYIKDKDLTYLKDIREGLQAYNKMFTGEKKQDVRHFYVFDEDRKLVYTGRAVDSPKDALRISVNDLDTVLDELTSGKELTLSATNPIGCNVKWDGKEKHWMPADACDLV